MGGIYKANTTFDENKRAKMMECATEMFFKYGIKKVKMDDIAKELSMSKRTLYEYYGDKENLALEMLRKLHRRNQGVYYHLKEGQHDAMFVMINWYVFLAMQVKTSSELFFRDLDKFPKIKEYLNYVASLRMQCSLDFAKDCIENGYFRSDINHELLVNMYELMEDAAINHRWRNDIDLAGHEYFDSVVLVIMRGACSEKGLKELARYDLCEENLYNLVKDPYNSLINPK